MAKYRKTFKLLDVPLESSVFNTGKFFYNTTIVLNGNFRGYYEYMCAPVNFQYKVYL